MNFFFQALSPEGVYKEVKPIKNAIVLNVGDLLQLWSNHHFQSTVHRVVAKQQGTTARQSIVFFTNPDNNHIIKSLYGTKSVVDHMNERNNDTVFDNWRHVVVESSLIAESLTHSVPRTS